MNRDFLKEEIQMTKSHMKKMLHITSGRCKSEFMPQRLAHITKRSTTRLAHITKKRTISAGRDMGRKELSFIDGGNVI